MGRTKTNWITVDELRNRLSISKTKAYQLAHEESLDTVKIGSSLRVREDSLERWLESAKCTKTQGGGEM